MAAGGAATKLGLGRTDLARLVDHAGCTALGTAKVLRRLLREPGLLTEHHRPSVAALGSSQVQRLEHRICTGTQINSETCKTEVKPVCIIEAGIDPYRP
jgi:hypothetical protein